MREVKDALQNQQLWAIRGAISDDDVAGRAPWPSCGRESNREYTTGTAGKTGGTIVGLRKIASVCAQDRNLPQVHRYAAHVRECYRLSGAAGADRLTAKGQARW